MTMLVGCGAETDEPDAAGTPLSENATATLEVPLSVDCSSVPDTAEARAQLEEHGLCGFGKPSQNSPERRTTGIVRGNCGTLRLDVWNSGGGTMGWTTEITSSIGPMLGASYAGDWLNVTVRNSGLVSNSTLLLLRHSWVDVKAIATLPGNVWAKLTAASTTLATGVVCVNNGFPASGAWITR
jgi:hypothetical protein